jgi:PAS domain S-box-containing protein
MKDKDLALQANKEIFLRAVEKQISLRQLALPIVFVLLIVLFILGRETGSLLLIMLGSGFIALSSLLFFFAAFFIRRTNNLSLEQCQQILSSIFTLEVLTIWLTFYLFAPVAMAHNISLPYLAIIFYICYIALVAPFFKENNLYQTFFYALIWIALAFLVFLNNNCQFLFDYGSSKICTTQPMMEGFLLIVSGVSIFIAQFIINNFQDQMGWATQKLQKINNLLQSKLEEESYQVVRIKQEQAAFRAKIAQRTREKDNQIKELTEKMKDRLDQKNGLEKVQEVSQIKQTTEALLNILEDTEEARQKAEEEREKTLTVINSFVDSLLVIDDQGLVQMVNNHARETFGLKRSIEGKSLLELANHPRLSLSLKHILDGRKIKIIKREGFEASEGSFFEVSTVPLVQLNESTSYLIVFHDVSRERLVQRMKTEFVSIAAHQLRTPLSAIKWSLRMMLDGDEGELSAGQKELMEKTYFSNQRMINLVNDLLNVSRIEEGRFLYETKETDLKEIIKDVIQAVRESAHQKEIEIYFQGEEKIFPPIKADQEKITLAIQNIIENAIKYSPEKGKIFVSLEEEDGFLLASVKDQGIGIPRAQQARVFQRFFRAGNAISQETEGTGLGLFISRNVIEAHKGKIWFESQENRGTTFYFTIPY